jgi:lipopolysaccharide export system protein LptA
MHKKSFILLFFIGFVFIFLSELFAKEEIRIEANMFEANENKKVSTFTGNVKIKKGLDRINSSKMRIFFDRENKPIKYEILKNVNFKITADNNSTYQGEAQKITLYPLEKKYIFKNSVKILELNTGRKIIGDEVMLNSQTGNIRILGTHKKPVIMIFKVDEE